MRGKRRPVQGEAQAHEQQICLGPCLLVRGVSPLWHTSLASLGLGLGL